MDNERLRKNIRVLVARIVELSGPYDQYKNEERLVHEFIQRLETGEDVSDIEQLLTTLYATNKTSQQ